MKKQKNKGIRKEVGVTSKNRNEDGSYIFPNILASSMRKVTQRVQYEAALMSLSIILVSLVSIGIFTIFFTDYSIGAKIMTAINTIALFVFMSSNLVTTYQQYFQYMNCSGIINDNTIKNVDIGYKDELDFIKKKSKELKESEEINEEIETPTTISEQIKKDILGYECEENAIEEIKNTAIQLEGGSNK